MLLRRSNVRETNSSFRRTSRDVIEKTCRPPLLVQVYEQVHILGFTFIPRYIFISALHAFPIFLGLGYSIPIYPQLFSPH